MIQQIANNSKHEGQSWSRLPTFSKEWVHKIRGSADFLGLNYYTSRYIEVPSKPTGVNPSHARDKNFIELVKPEWKRGASDWLYSVPQGLADVLRYLTQNESTISLKIRIK